MPSLLPAPAFASNLKSRITLVVAVIVLLVGNYMLAHPKYDSNLFNYYNHLGEAFLKGQTFLDTPVAPALLRKADPYDPKQHKIHSLWDASLHNGKYYLYFGPVPALVFWIPAKVLFEVAPPPALAAYIFVTIGLMCLLFLLKNIFFESGVTRSNHAWLVAFCAVCYGSWFPHIIDAHVYEVAVSGAFCFSALGIMCFWHALRKGIPNTSLLYFVSLFFGLAVGCRYTHALNIVLIIYLAKVTYDRCPRDFIKNCLALFIPWLICIELLASYNYVRFGNPFETGLNYLLTIVNVRSPDFRAFSIEYFFNNLYFYFFHPLEWLSPTTFPPFRILIGDNVNLFGIATARSSEPVYGLLVNSPFILFLVLPFKKYTHTVNSTWLFTGCLGYGLIMLTLMLFFFFCTQRYAVDFTPWLMLAAAIRFLLVLRSYEATKQYINILWLGYVLSAYSAFNGIMLSISR